MTMLELYTAHHLRHTESTKGGRPVRNGKPGIIRGYKSAGDDQQERREGHEGSVASKPGVVRGRLHRLTKHRLPRCRARSRPVHGRSLDGLQVDPQRRQKAKTREVRAAPDG